MTRLFLVRHGQSEWNAQGRWQGQADPPLSSSGREEARLAADRLDGFSGSFIASPLLRARQTAEIIADELGDGTVHVENDLREIDVGGFSGLTNDEIAERFPDEWAALRGGSLRVFPTGEAREAFRIRVLAALDVLTSLYQSGELLVVTHGGAIGAIERHLDVHPGVGVRNLEGRWFEASSGVIEIRGDRVNLVGDQSS